MSGDDVPNWRHRLRRRRDPKWDSFSWLTVRALFSSVNDVIGKQSHVVVQSRRARWVAAQRSAGMDAHVTFDPDAPFAPNFVIDRRGSSAPLRCIVIGDTGEADASQYVCIDPLLAVHRDGPRKSQFMVTLSDEIYPAGDVNDYVNGFYIPYEDYDRPIYAIPGNHDWYDGLNGFMWAFCQAQPLPSIGFRAASYRPAELLAGALWRSSSRPDDRLLSAYRYARAPRSADPERRMAAEPVQPAPYWAIRTNELALVAVDTGIAGELDADQGRWLVEVSKRIPEPKVLLTGKPIYVDNRYRPGHIEWDSHDKYHGVTVDDIVRQYDYVAAIGGDTHNYQRYPVRVRSENNQPERTVQYIVSGGGGAYLSPTHQIGKPGDGRTASALPPGHVTLPEENDFACYPSRAESLVYFARRAGPRLVLAFGAACVLLLAGMALVFAVVPLSGNEELTVAGTLLAVAVAGGLGAVLSKKLGPIPGVLAAAAAPIALVALLVAEGDGRLWATAGLTLAAPVAVALGLVMSYEWRGSVPGALSMALMAAPIVVGVLLLVGAPDFHGASAALMAVIYGLATVTLIALTRGLGAWHTRVQRRRRDLRDGNPEPGRLLRPELLLWDAFVALPIALLAAVAALERDSWVAESALVIAVAAVLIGWVLPRFVPNAAEQPDPLASRDWGRLMGIDRLARTLAALAWFTLALVGLDALHAAWVPLVLIESLGVLLGYAAIAFFVVFAFDLRSWVGVFWVGFVLIAIAALVAESWPLFGLGLLVAGIGVAFTYADPSGGPLTLLALRSGELDGAYATDFVKRKLAGTKLPRSERRESKPDERIANAIYGREDAIAKRLVTELSDTNDPPFHKNFLTLQVDSAGGVSKLKIEVYGVIGDESKDQVPATVDEIDPITLTRRAPGSPLSSAEPRAVPEPDRSPRQQPSGAEAAGSSSVPSH